jgi:hypothetical protein
MLSRGREPRDEGEEKEVKAAERRQIPRRAFCGLRHSFCLSPLWGSLIYVVIVPGAHGPGLIVYRRSAALTTR